MALDNELRLINAAWKSDDGWKAMVSEKLTPEMFFNADAAAVYKFALDQKERHGKFPSETFTKNNFPNFPRVKIADPPSMLIAAFKEWRKSQVIKQHLETATEAYAQGDFDKALTEMESGVTQVAVESISDAGDVDLTENALDRYKEYEEFEARRKAGGALIGVTTGFPTLDAVLSGLQPKQLITVVALPKVGKSTLAMQMGIKAHEAGCDVMFVTIEMSRPEMMQRHDAMRAGISLFRFRTGALKNSEKRKYNAMLTHMDALNATASFHITESVSNLAQVAAKIDEFKPKIVIVDGVYLLQSHPDFPPGSAQALTYLSRSFKRMAQTTDTTIILTTQALAGKLQGGKVTEHSIGYSSSFLQDADLVIGLEHNDAKDPDARVLSILASRNSSGATVTLDWDFDNGIFAELGTP